MDGEFDDAAGIRAQSTNNNGRKMIVIFMIANLKPKANRADQACQPSVVRVSPAAMQRRIAFGKSAGEGTVHGYLHPSRRDRGRCDQSPGDDSFG